MVAAVWRTEESERVGSVAHAAEAARVLAELGGRLAGLSEQEAATREAAGGPRRRKPAWRVAVEELVEALTEPLQLLLIAVGVLSAVFGQLRDAIAIFVIVGLVATVETVTEARARRALRSLRALTAPIARVRRDGELRIVASGEVVVGDVEVLEAGDVVVGDGRVLRADGLRADESALTGEPVAAPKGPEPVAAREEQWNEKCR